MRSSSWGQLKAGGKKSPFERVSVGDETRRSWGETTVVGKSGGLTDGVGWPWLSVFWKAATTRTGGGREGA